MLLSLTDSSLAACVYQGANCVLTINIDDGFILQDADMQKLLWQEPFSKLIRSSDDNKRLLRLTFAGGKEIVSKFNGLQLSVNIEISFFAGTRSIAKPETIYLHIAHFSVCKCG